MMISQYNFVLQAGSHREARVVGGVLVGTFFSFLVGVFNPAVVNKAGPDWMWAGGRGDVLRNLYFRPNGSFRRYGFIGLVCTLAAGSTALVWLLQRL